MWVCNCFQYFELFLQVLVHVLSVFNYLFFDRHDLPLVHSFEDLRKSTRTYAFAQFDIINVDCERSMWVEGDLHRASFHLIHLIVGC